jgi:pSer/pThr/pTyr-binding forkhead associated (FHA) protein
MARELLLRGPPGKAGTTQETGHEGGRPMFTEVTLTATEGRLKGREFVFRSPTRCIVGRASDCYVWVPDGLRTVSRHHCLFDIAPPMVQVRDLGSLNGTYVNGERIGWRDVAETPEEGVWMPPMSRWLRDGDEVRVGTTVFRVGVVEVLPVEPAETLPLEWAEGPAMCLAC